jgi:hypothetical protein
MTKSLRGRFWVEAVLGSVTGFLTLLTLVTREWIEILFGVDPDGGSGSLEWAIVVALLEVTVAFSALARAEWRRSMVADSQA